ncbi:matrixin family metalloprotease [Candidatus Roizmanbacteria bacterium]|nr:matrixin family metalloprotease [Candidatus Roizmanbacteria bacterium]
MSKKLLLFLILAFGFFILPFVVSAQKPEDWEPPERNGVYDVPGRKDLKVRVFVHERPNQSPVLIACAVDNNSNAVTGETGWYLPTNWTYYVNPSVPSSISSNLSTIVENSFNAWRTPLSGKVNFNYAGTTNIGVKKLDGKNIIAWGRTSGSALGVTYTWYYTANHQAAETDTIMNKKFAWGWNEFQCDSSYYDAQNILTHELGHWVGLNDHYTDAYVDNTMYGYGSKGEIKKDTLTTGDINGLSSIYP